MTKEDKRCPQIKICGLTRIEHAAACAEFGADALGFIFYAKSPRHLSREKAAEIIHNIQAPIATVGVFVNETFETIMEHVEFCGLTAVQLHGHESPKLVNRLRSENIRVIKALFSEKAPSMEEVRKYDADAYLVECGKGILPGGNALTWNWGDAKPFGEKYPLILAGGLSADNIVSAVTAALPEAVDVSSGVEISPGIKDIEKIQKFIHAVSTFESKSDIPSKKFRNVFG
jgi:phosphoribosylanthranilate isomerase